VTAAIQHKLSRLATLIRRSGPALIAYSGGVDSALVATVAQRELDGRCLACIAVSPSYPARERREAVAFAESIGLRWQMVSPNEHRDARYAANGEERCYFCRSGLFRLLRRTADEEGWATILDGVHADDVADHAHGMRAAREVGVASPLLEAGLHKADVREMARELGLSVWDKPAAACLASRVPRGVPITPGLLAQIDAAETVVAAMGFREFRVRHHGDVARLEFPTSDFPRAMQLRESLVAGLRGCGYRFVTLDLGGLRSGSLSQATSATQFVALGVAPRSKQT
jgi:uncharacterized protein